MATDEHCHAFRRFNSDDRSRDLHSSLHIESRGRTLAFHKNPSLRWLSLLSHSLRAKAPARSERPFMHHDDHARLLDDVGMTCKAYRVTVDGFVMQKVIPGAEGETGEL